MTPADYRERFANSYCLIPFDYVSISATPIECGDQFRPNRNYVVHRERDTKIVER